MLSGTTSGRAAFAFGHDGSNTFHAVVLRKNAGTDTIKLVKYTSGSGWGSTLDSASATITAGTEYTIRGWVRQKAVYAALDGQNADFTYNSSTFFGAGKVGCASDTASTCFDDFTYLRATPHDPGVPGWNTTAAVTLTTGAGTLTVTRDTYGGAAVSQWAGDDDYVAQADIDLNSGAMAHLIIRYTDPDNWMAAEIRSNGSVKLIKCLDGRETNVASNTYTTAATVNVRIKASGTTYTIWVDGTQKISTTDGDLAWGTLALSGRQPKFSNVKAGYDNNADGDIDDAGDDLVLSETFAATAYTLNADHSDGTNDAWDRAGNLIDDGQMRYTYDAWNHLVKVTRKQDTDIVIQTAEYDGLGRRVSKVVTKSGGLDGTFVYYYADTQAGGSLGGASTGGWSIVEIRDGSNNVYQQVYHGTQYIDEIVAMRLEQGYAVVYQDANWNTIATCDLAGRVLERVFTTPYGSPIIEPETFFGDYDGDGDVDATDDGFLGSGQTCWGTPSGACRVFDFNQDGTLNASDETVMSALVAAASTNRRHENRTSSPTGMEFLHQARIHDKAICVYDNRLRGSSHSLSRFLQRDPLGFKDGLNAYESVASNPQTKRDPMGNTWCPFEGKIVIRGDCCITLLDNEKGNKTVCGPGEFCGDGLEFNGRIIKVPDDCTYIVRCDNPVHSGCICMLWGTCTECEPGFTICYDKCLKWKTNQPHSCNYDWRRSCAEWRCSPDKPFNVPGYSCNTDVNGMCNNDGVCKDSPSPCDHCL